MNMDQIFEKLKGILVDSLSISAEEVEITSNFKNDLGADSLDLVEMIMAVEEQFDVEISDDEIVKIETVKDAVEILSVKIA